MLKPKGMTRREFFAAGAGIAGMAAFSAGAGAPGMRRGPARAPPRRAARPVW